MKSYEIAKIHKDIFDNMYCKFKLTKERLDAFIEILADDEELSDRHYNVLRRYAIKRYYELGAH